MRRIGESNLRLLQGHVEGTGWKQIVRPWIQITFLHFNFEEYFNEMYVVELEIQGLKIKEQPQKFSTKWKTLK